MNQYSKKREDRMLEQHLSIAWYKFFMWILLPCFAAFSMSGITIDICLWAMGQNNDPIGLHMIVYITMSVVLVFTIYTFCNMYRMKSYWAMILYIVVLPLMIVLNKLLPMLFFSGLMINPNSVTSSIILAFLFVSTSLLYFPRRKLLFDDMHYRYIDYNKEQFHDKR